MGNGNMIGRAFSQKILHQITVRNKSDVVDEVYDFYIQGPRNINTIQRMKSLYNYLKKSYRSEYFYKNTMFNRLLLELHSVNTTTALSEMPIGNSVADLILLNDRSVVYGVKTKLDKLGRLDNQISDYYGIFNYVVVIIDDKHLDKAMAKYKDAIVGILISTSRNTLSEAQKPKENSSLSNSKTMYNLLRKEKGKRVTTQNHMDMPIHSDFTEHDVLSDVLKEIPMTRLHNNMIFGLKRRGNMKEYKDELLAVPTEIKFLLYFAKMTKKNKNKLYHSLKDTNNPPHFA